MPHPNGAKSTIFRLDLSPSALSFDCHAGGDGPKGAISITRIPMPEAAGGKEQSKSGKGSFDGFIGWWYRRFRSNRMSQFDVLPRSLAAAKAERDLSQKVNSAEGDARPACAIFLRPAFLNSADSLSYPCRFLPTTAAEDKQADVREKDMGATKSRLCFSGSSRAAKPKPTDSPNNLSFFTQKKRKRLIKTPKNRVSTRGSLKKRTF